MVLMESQLGYRPPPPPLPKYDPNEDAPKWSWTRLRYSLPVDKGPIPWTPIGTQPDSPDKPDWRGVIRNNVIELPMPGEYKYGQPSTPKYFWFDTPDHADPFKKMWYSFKWFLRTGLLALSVRGVVEGRKFTVANNWRLCSKILFPWLAAGLAGSSTVIVLANLRNKKDDYWNYAAAGMMMACILGRKDHAVFFRATVMCVPGAVVVKHNAEINGHLFPMHNFRMTNIGLGMDSEHGLVSGDTRLGLRGTLGDPGRDIRRVY